MTATILSSPPSTGAVLARAAISPLLKRDRKPILPTMVLGLNGVRTERERLSAYNRACGFAPSAIPATWLHILAYPIHGALMTHDEFPFPMIGLVHISNMIRQEQPLTLSDAVDIRARLGNMRAHDKGVLFSVLTEVELHGKKIWEEESVYLRRGKFRNLDIEKAPSAADDVPVEDPDDSRVWDLSEDLGRRYGAASGDMNPIHLHALTAKAFGFPRAIAHGMWTQAHALSELMSFVEGKPFALSTHFKLPAFLPSKVNFRQKRSATSVQFEVRDGKGVKPHARGRVELL